MTAVRLKLLVIRSRDLSLAERFYSALGLRFSREKHGSGPEHLATDLEGTVFEIYPLKADSQTATKVRLGLQVESIDHSLNSIIGIGGEIRNGPSATPWGVTAVVLDPDGNSVELSE